MNSTTRPHATIGWPEPLAVFAALGVVTLLMAPMMAIKPRDLPIAVANLDAGASTPQGELNVGDQVVAQLTGSNMNGMVKWVTYASQSEIDEALESNEVYGARRAGGLHREQCRRSAGSRGGRPHHHHRQSGQEPDDQRPTQHCVQLNGRWAIYPSCSRSTTPSRQPLG